MPGRGGASAGRPPIQCGTTSATCPPAQDDSVTHARHRTRIVRIRGAMPHQSADRTRRQPNRVTRTPDQHPMLPLDLKRAGPLSKHEPFTAPTNPTPIRPEGTACRPLLPKIIRAAATSASRRMTLTVQVAALLPPRDRTGLTMLTAMAAIFIVLSIGILIAHALDAFRSR